MHFAFVGVKTSRLKKHNKKHGNEIRCSSLINGVLKS